MPFGAIVVSPSCCAGLRFGIVLVVKWVPLLGTIQAVLPWALIRTSGFRAAPVPGMPESTSARSFAAAIIADGQNAELVAGPNESDRKASAGASAMASVCGRLARV